MCAHRSGVSVMDDLLSDPNYDFEDVFLGVWNQSPKLTKDDWLAILELAVSRDQQWEDNLLTAGPFEILASEPLLSAVFSLLRKRKRLAINLLSQIGSENLTKNLSDEMIDKLVHVWNDEPELRDKVELITEISDFK